MSNNIEQIVQTIEHLPTLPSVAISIQSILNDPTSSARDLERIVSSDSPLAAKILKLANSAYFGLPQKIASLTQAISYLGFSLVKNIALGISVFETFESSTIPVHYSRENLWHHFLAVASIARNLAKEKKGVDSDTAFSAGLLHDIGKLLIDRYFSDSFIFIFNLCTKENISFYEAEKQISKFTHQEIGAALLEHWKFPQQIIEATRYHHSPGEFDSNNPNKKYVYLVAIANSIANQNGLCFQNELVPFSLSKDVVKLFGISDNRIQSIVKKVKSDTKITDILRRV